jgi:hypothetical protein
MLHWKVTLTAAVVALLIAVASLGGQFDFIGFHW